MVSFCAFFGLKTGIDFAHFGVESSMVFEGVTGVHELKLSFQLQISKKEREIREFEMNLKNFFCLRSNLRDDDIISA